MSQPHCSSPGLSLDLPGRAGTKGCRAEGGSPHLQGLQAQGTRLVDAGQGGEGGIAVGAGILPGQDDDGHAQTKQPAGLCRATPCWIVPRAFPCPGQGCPPLLTAAGAPRGGGAAAAQPRGAGLLQQQLHLWQRCLDRNYCPQQCEAGNSNVNICKRQRGEKKKQKKGPLEQKKAPLEPH